MKHKAKYGLNSGNTFHFGDQVPYLTGSVVRSENVIVKTVKLERGVKLPFVTATRSSADEVLSRRDPCWLRLERLIATTVPDGGLSIALPEIRWYPDIPLTLSLNKHKRWMLPELIKNRIQQRRSEKANCLQFKSCRNSKFHDRYGRQARQKKQLGGSLDARDNDNCGFSADIRLTFCLQLVTSGDIWAPLSFRRSCVEYDDSAAVAVTSRPSAEVTSRNSRRSRRVKYSNSNDLRDAMRPLVSEMVFEETEQTTASASAVVSNDATEGFVSRRFHTRGTQRLTSVVKMKRSDDNRELQQPCRRTISKDQTRSIPEVHYDICMAKPLMAHRCQRGLGHHNKYPGKICNFWMVRHFGKFRVPKKSHSLYEYIRDVQKNELNDDCLTVEVTTSASTFDVEELSADENLQCSPERLLLVDVGHLIELANKRSASANKNTPTKGLSMKSSDSPLIRNRASSQVAHCRGKGNSVIIDII